MYTYNANPRAGARIGCIHPRKNAHRSTVRRCAVYAFDLDSDFKDFTLSCLRGPYEEAGTNGEPVDRVSSTKFTLRREPGLILSQISRGDHGRQPRHLVLQRSKRSLLQVR